VHRATVSALVGLVACHREPVEDGGGGELWPTAALGIALDEGGELEDGAEVRFEAGGQGGFHVDLGAWAQIEVPEIWLDVRIVSAEEEEIALTPEPVGIALADFDDEDCTGWATARTYLGGTSSGPTLELACAMEEQPVTVVASIAPLDAPSELHEVSVDAIVAIPSGFCP